jgi:hypothetical protein
MMRTRIAKFAAVAAKTLTAVPAFDLGIGSGHDSSASAAPATQNSTPGTDRAIWGP